MSACFIGTSGWNYKHWANGRFYPPKLPQRQWLAYYAGHHNTVEINNSFYRIPSGESMAAWAAAVPAGFKFAAKIWRGITHYRKLRACTGFLQRFFEFADVLDAGRRGPMLLQLPPNLKKDLRRLDEFLDEFHAQADGRWKLAVEFRSGDWLSDDTYRLLERHRAAVALADGRYPCDEPNDVSFVYMRRHGAAAPEGRYQPQHIRADAKLVRGWLRAGKSVYVYYNNDWGGHAVDNAAQLIEAVV